MKTILMVPFENTAVSGVCGKSPLLKVALSSTLLKFTLWSRRESKSKVLLWQPLKSTSFTICTKAKFDHGVSLQNENTALLKPGKYANTTF